MTSSQENDILWHTQLGSECKTCSNPTGNTRAKACIRAGKTSLKISETDIKFNASLAWSYSWVLGIATHEFGHAGGLEHDSETSDGCVPTFTGRFTMCGKFNSTNVGWAGHLEDHDIEDANAKY